MTDFHTGLGKNAANHQPLTPIDFIIRSDQVYPDKTAIIYDDLEHNNLMQTWQQTYDRCRQLADGLRKLGIDKNDTVAVMMPNTPAMVECAFGVPMSGGVLCTLNTRLDIKRFIGRMNHDEIRKCFFDNFSMFSKLAV